MPRSFEILGRSGVAWLNVLLDTLWSFLGRFCGSHDPTNSDI